MTAPAPSADLLHALGRLVRGLSALFWGLPVALIVCVQTAKAEFFKPLGVLPPLAATALLLYGITQLGHFQRQETVWRTVLDRTRLLALANLGLSPFLYWWRRVPDEPYFLLAVSIFGLSALLFMFNLNHALQRLTAMLPEETLRTDARVFSTLNLYLLLAILLFAVGYVFLLQVPAPAAFLAALLSDGEPHPLPLWLLQALAIYRALGLWMLVFMALVPLAMTMALLWKTKEVILAGVFGSSPT